MKRLKELITETTTLSLDSTNFSRHILGKGRISSFFEKLIQRGLLPEENEVFTIVIDFATAVDIKVSEIDCYYGLDATLVSIEMKVIVLNMDAK